MMMTHLPARAALTRAVHRVAAALVLTLTRARAVRSVQSRRTRRVAPIYFSIRGTYFLSEIFLCLCCKVKFVKVCRIISSQYIFPISHLLIESKCLVSIEKIYGV